MDNKGTVKFQKITSEYIKDVVLSNWHFMRWLRLVLGVFVLWQVIQRPDIFTGLIAVFLLFQAVTNTGCCGAGGCAVPSKGKKPAGTEVDYEEVK